MVDCLLLSGTEGIEKMKIGMVSLWMISMLIVVGCGHIPGFGSTEQVIPLTQVDQRMKQRLPITRKASFGSVKIVGVALQPGTEGKEMEASAKFILTSFEIPEGIEGIITYRADLRYAPGNRSLYLGTLKPLRLTFANPSLEEYVSARARKGIESVVASVLRTLPIQTLPESTRVKKIKKFAIQKETLRVDFE